MSQVPILQTKMHIPPVRPELVSRPRLLEKLNAGLAARGSLSRALTVISAPAGFGKTTLLSEWVAGSEGFEPRVHAAWLSLDEGDNDPARFLTYVIAALQTLNLNADGPSGVVEVEAQQEPATPIGKRALSALRSASVAGETESAPNEVALTSLINDLIAIPDRILLILDDFHLMEAQSIHADLTFLLAHLPPQMHLVIATREDPHLPLARLRARGQLTELRAADLRFSHSEAAEFLNRAMGLDLSAEDIAALEARTEGWIAGLQLAAVALQGHRDPASFVKAFGGSHRFVLDYLLEEVLEQQSESVQAFLLQTAILDQLTGPLCDAVRFGTAETPSRLSGTAVTGQGGGASPDSSQAILEMLERANLFIVPLDQVRRRYRYYHLFAGILRQRLRERHLDLVPTLHTRASEWYEANDHPADSIRHALAAQDFKRAADLAERAWPAMSGSGQSIVWLGWLEALPDDQVRARPVLCVGYAFALLSGGRLEAAEARLLDAERWLEPDADSGQRLEDPAAQMIVAEPDQYHALPLWLAAARAYHAQAIGDQSATLRYTQRALDLLPEGDHPWRASFTVLQGMINWVQGDLEAAYRAVSDGLGAMQRIGDIAGAMSGVLVQVDIKIDLGHLREALGVCESSLRIAAEQGAAMPLGTEDVYIGQSWLHRELGDLEAAAQDLLTAKKLGEQVDLPDWRHRWCMAQARLEVSLGDLDKALDLLEKASRLHVRTPLPDVRPIAAWQARIWAIQGRLAKTQAWVRKRELAIDDDLTYMREFEHITLARLLIAQYKSDRAEAAIDDAMSLLKRLLQEAEEGKRMGSVIEILVQQAVAHEAQGRIPPALVSLERALALAEPEGYLRVFADEGPPVRRLLEKLRPSGVAAGYAAQILAALETVDGQRPAAEKESESSAAHRPPSTLIEPLTKRELEVLQLIADGLTNQEIANQLYVSLNTVKTHTRNIYGKLDAHHRTVAVVRARALGVLPAP